jgi:hypothetical protein
MRTTSLAVLSMWILLATDPCMYSTISSNPMIVEYTAGRTLPTSTRQIRRPKFSTCHHPGTYLIAAQLYTLVNLSTVSASKPCLVPSVPIGTQAPALFETSHDTWSWSMHHVCPQMASDTSVVVIETVDGLSAEKMRALCMRGKLILN